MLCWLRASAIKLTLSFGKADGLSERGDAFRADLDLLHKLSRPALNEKSPIRGTRPRIGLYFIFFCALRSAKLGETSSFARRAKFAVLTFNIPAAFSDARSHRVPPTAVGGIKSDKIKPEGVYLGFYTAHGHRCDFCEAIECRCPCVPLILKGRRPFKMNAERYT